MSFISVTKKNLTLIVLALLVIVVSALNFIPSAKEAVKNFILGNDREILSQVEGDITGQGDRFQILKVKDRDTLSLEVYAVSSDQKITFKNRLILPDTKDGHFEFRGQSTNLVLTDIDNDGVSEIVAPTYDKNLSPRLNVFKFKSSDQSFERVEAKNYL